MSEIKNYKAPPAFDEGNDYADFKMDIELWMKFTNLEKKKQGTAFLLELKEGKVKNAVRSLGIEVISQEDGLENIINHLDKIYEEDSAQLSYRIYCKFEKYVRPEDMHLQSYISEFEKMVADLRKQKIILPEAVLAYRFLNSANLSPEKVDLALATVKELTYDEMSMTVGKIFSVQTNVSALDEVSSSSGAPVKVETQECNFAAHHSRRNHSRGYNRSSKRPMRYQRGYNSTRRNHYPYNGLGKRSRTQTMCYECNEMGHIARDCPKNSDKDVHYFTQSNSTASTDADDSMEIPIESTYFALFTTLVTENPSDCIVKDLKSEELGSLVFESLSCAIIDSGCTKTVVGRSWLNNYCDTLEEGQKKLMSTEKCSVPFRFGDGKQNISKEIVKIPGRIGKQNILIDANVVECELPLLLSKPSLKKAGAVIDFSQDKMSFNGQSVELQETSSGHYCVPICSKRRLVSEPIDCKKHQLVLTVTDEALFSNDINELKKKATKLHRQFAHAPGYKLITLLKSAGYERKIFSKVIEDVCSTCEICVRYKKPKARPIVGLPRGKTFNEIVALDLKCLEVANNIYFLHMIDMVSRFSAAKIIHNKRKETISSALCTNWIALFGAPSKFMADNGGEFSNKEFIDLCEQFNIEIQSSAAESPFSNGMVERHHRVLTELAIKTKADTNCSWEIALSWSLNAKNSMQMYGGFSAYQLSIGRNPSLPNVINN